jgi:hypothetical protein
MPAHDLWIVAHGEEGFEPFAEHTKVPHNQSILDSARTGNTQIRAQITGALERELSQVDAAWSKLPCPPKAAILAIGFPDATFDYFFSKNVLMGKPIITQSNVSDHLPVTCDVTIQ